VSATKAERMVEFRARLAKAPSASSAEEALALVNRVLDQVEDELSGIPYDPAAVRQLVTDGRMYGPHASFASSWKDRHDITRFAHARHDTFIRDNGVILIRLRNPLTILLSKPGADGREVDP
jgi:hypothetical protein